MTSNRFFVPSKALAGERVELTGKEHHHLSRVVRVKAGHEVWLFDGRGASCRAEVEAVTADRTRLRIVERGEGETAERRIILAQALLKPKAMELVIQKATELGVGVLAPVTAERSVSRVEDKAARKVERWETIAREAAKQCGAPVLPVLRPPRTLEATLAEEAASRRVYLSEHGGRHLRELLGEMGSDGKEGVLFAVGPEGGWTPAEEELLRRSGCQAASLGPLILRAETAALCVAAAALLWTG